MWLCTETAGGVDEKAREEEHQQEQISMVPTLTEGVLVALK